MKRLTHMGKLAGNKNSRFYLCHRNEAAHNYYDERQPHRASTKTINQFEIEQKFVFFCYALSQCTQM